MKSRNSTLVGFGTDDHYLDAYKRTRCLEFYNFTLQQVYAWRVWVSLTRISLYNWRTGSQFISLLECPGAVRVLSCVGWHMIIRQGGWKNRTLMVGIDIYSIFLPKDHCVLALGAQEDEGGAPSLFKTLQQDNRGGRFNSPRLSQIKICNVLLPESIENEFRWWRQAFQVQMEINSLKIYSAGKNLTPPHRCHQISTLI